MLDCSGWNDFNIFVEAIKKKNIKNTGIEKRFHPVRDILATSEAEIRKKIKSYYSILKENKDIRAYMRVDGISSIGDFEQDLNSVRRFVEISREYSYIN